MVDEGLIPILGNEPGDGKNSDSDGKRLPLLKGPVVDYVYVVDEEVFENGDEIVAQNRYGTWFWVILEGMVEVVRIFPQGPAPILRLGEGAFIGSIVSFLREGNTRSASIYAVGRVQLGVVDSELIAREYSVLSDMFRNILISLDKRMKQLTDVCAAMVLDQQEPLVDQPRGNLFISRESNEKKVFFIKRGQAFVYKNIKDKYLHLLTLEKGDLIGRIAFLNSAHEPYSAQVYLSEDTEVYPVDLDNLHQEYQELSGTFKNMIRNLTNSISVTTGRIQDIITH
jgi:CRP-like cAMP-binding protein